MKIRSRVPPTRHPAVKALLALCLWILAPTAAAYHCEGSPITVHQTDALPKPLLFRRQSDDTWRYQSLSFEDGEQAEASASKPVNANRKARFRTVSRSDFNGDGEPDLLLQNVVNKQGGRWLMNLLDGNRILAKGALKQLKTGPAWVLVSSDDHDGDGRADILLRNENTGQWFLYLMDGMTVLDSGPVAMSQRLSDVFVGTGDFNRDGRRDVLLRRANGRWLMYPMNGLAEPPTRQPDLPDSADLIVLALADFNGDRRTDLLMRNVVNGNWKMFILQGARVVNRGPVALPKSLAVHLEAVADFSGDGRADALLRRGNGVWLLYALKARTVLAEGSLDMPRQASVLLVDVADYTGDGLADLLTRKADGGWKVYEVDGTVPAVTSEASPALMKFPVWVPQFGCLYTDEDNDVYLGRHISTSGAQAAGRQALSDGLDMGLDGAASQALSEPVLMLLQALGFTITTEDPTDVASPASVVAANPAAAAAAAPLTRIEQRLQAIAVDPDRVEDEFNVAQQEATDLAEALLTNPTRTGNVVVYRPDPEATCSLESVVSFIESLASDIITQENCVEVLGELAIVQTVETEDSGRIAFRFGEHEPFWVTYAPDVGTANVDLDAQREAVLLLIDILQPTEPPTVPDILTGEIQTAVTMLSETSFTTSVSIKRPIEVSSTSDGQVVSFAVEAKDDVYSSTVDEDAGSVVNMMDTPPIVLALPVEDIDDETIFYPGEIEVPSITGTSELDTEANLLTVTDGSLGGLPIIYDVNDQRALEAALADFDLEVDAEANTISLPDGLDAGITFFEVPGVAGPDEAGALNWDAQIDTRFLVHEFEATETEEAYVILEVLQGQFDVLGTGVFVDSGFSLLSGLCYQSIDGLWEEVTCPVPAP